MTARAATSAIVRRDMRDCTSIRTFAGGVRGRVSVGLNAVALVKAI